MRNFHISLLISQIDSVYRVGFSAIDRVTSRVSVCERVGGDLDREFALDEVLKLLLYYQPARVVVTFATEYDSDALEYLLCGVRYEYVLNHKRVSIEEQNDLFKSSFALHSLLDPIEHLNLQDKSAASEALAITLLFDDIGSLRLIEPTILDYSSQLYLGNNALEQLQIVSAESAKPTLLGLVDLCITVLGSRLLRDRLCNPITCKSELERRYDLVDRLYPYTKEMSLLLAPIGDLQTFECVQMHDSLLGVKGVVDFVCRHRVCEPTFDTDLLDRLIGDVECSVRKFEREYYRLVVDICDFIAGIDVALSSAIVAKKHSFARPIIVETEENFLQIVQLRHPLIEQIEPYVAQDIVLGDIQNIDLPYPNSVLLDPDVRRGKDVESILLYGINSSGKSSLIKSVAHAVVLAQAGFFVCASAMRFRLYESLFTRITSHDDIERKRGSFAVEMSELDNIFVRATSRSLVVCDEIAHGTETLSSVAIVGSTILQLSRKKCTFLLTTHLHQLSQVEQIQKHKSVAILHLSVEYDESSDRLIYNRVLQSGSGSSSYGLEFATSLHMNQDFLDDAVAIRDSLRSLNRT